ncbi:MAG TPA: uroporphyrinogen-III synthase [Actinomycetota bacterium]|nr:uroporphyrinogen-III synthase [Actinomycetota bacterium]
MTPETSAGMGEAGPSRPGPGVREAGRAPWGDEPLAGRVVLVTRPRPQAAELVSLLRARGARPLLAPAIWLAPGPAAALDRALDELARGGFAWAVFTSRAGVEAVLGRLAARGLGPGDVRARLAAVGEGTAAALKEAGLRPELVPRTFTTAALARAFPRGEGRVLLARADLAGPDLEAALARKGWTPLRVDAYRTRLASRLPARVRRELEAGRVDAVTFTSASTVDGFLRMLGPAGPAALPHPPPRVVCIGPVTARAARARGLAVDAVARPHTIEGLVRAVERTLAPGGRPKAGPGAARAARGARPE